jgi:hypothetical protein
MKNRSEILNRVQRGLAGYVSYLAACDVNSAFSEYTLYEPILRILATQRFAVTCEYPCPWRKSSGRGDRKRIDFMAVRNNRRIAMEVKWARSRRINVASDHAKLLAVRKKHPATECYLCVFGRKSNVEAIRIDTSMFVETRTPVYARFGITQYGCLMFSLVEGND